MSTENCSRVLSLISINTKETPAKASSTTCQISSFDNEQGTLRHWHRSGSVKLVESKVFLINASPSYMRRRRREDFQRRRLVACDGLLML